VYSWRELQGWVCVVTDNLIHPTSVEANSFVDGNSIGVAMSISGSDTGDLEVSISSEVSPSETERDNPGVTTFREEFDITVSLERETEDCREQNTENDVTNTTQLQLDEEDGCTVEVSLMTKETGSGHVNDKTGGTTTLVDRDVEYRRITGLKLENVAETLIKKKTVKTFQRF